MEDLNINLKERTGFFKEIGPGIAQEMSKSLENLTAEKIKVEFSSVQAFDEGSVSVDVKEKCFGSYVNFTSSRPVRGSLSNRVQGVVVAIFPVSSTRTSIELLLKRYLKKSDKETIDYKMKLSAFKETTNILILSYITGLANALEIKLKIGVPKFACFRNVEFMRSSLSRSYSKSESLVSVGQFRISGGMTRFHLLKGALLLFFSRTLREENL